MKKNYIIPKVLFTVLKNEDICTASAGTLEANEYENTNQWWNVAFEE